MKIVTRLNLLLSEILDVLFPRKCVGCGETGKTLCDDCLNDLPASKWNPDSPQYIETLFTYGNPIVKKAIWTLKYRGDKEIARRFGEALYDRIIDALYGDALPSNVQNICIVPIPMSSRKLRARGFNQSIRLAKAVIDIDENNLFSINKKVLKKHKDTPAQTTLKNKKERVENMHGAFSVAHPEKVRGQVILVIDDVWTTGATLSEARRVLLEAGAKVVLAFTVAH
jgi:competence protein ComFC